MAISYLQVRTRTNRRLNNKPVIHNRIWEWLSRSLQSQRTHNKSCRITAQAPQQTNRPSDKPCSSSSKIVRAVLRLRRCSSSRHSSSDKLMLLKAQPTRCYLSRRMQRIKCSSIISTNRRVEASSSLLPLTSNNRCSRQRLTGVRSTLSNHQQIVAIEGRGTLNRCSISLQALHLVPVRKVDLEVTQLLLACQLHQETPWLPLDRT